MMILAFFRADTPTTIDGALVSLILALAVIIPVLMSGVIVPLVKAYVARINTGTNKNIAELTVFKYLSDEVGRLTKAHDQDELDKQSMRHDILELQQIVFLREEAIKNKDIIIKGLQADLDDCRGLSPAPTVAS